MATRAQQGDVSRVRATRALEVTAVPREEPSFGTEGGSDALSILVVPTAALDAALELGKRMGGLSVAVVIGMALQRLAEQVERKGR